MRSRLEAAWAEQFDAWQVRWEYEPRCFASEEGQYLPDFLTHPWDPEQHLYVEVKPASFLPIGPEATTKCGEECNRWLRILQASDPLARLWIVSSADPNGSIAMLDVDPEALFGLGFVNFSTLTPIASLHARDFWWPPCPA
jgi:hypothetical protein